MRLVIQRVSEARVAIAQKNVAAIGRGLLVFVGIEDADEQEDALWLAGKLCSMRLFADNEGKMNLSLLEIGGELLVVSQFTLHASIKKGNRPSFLRAARPEKAVPLYEEFLKACQQELKKIIQSGEFGADMEVFLKNDGPVTILIDSRARQ